MDSSYSPPHHRHHHSPFASICTEMPDDHVFNMSPGRLMNHSLAAELVKEIETLEVKIVNLESYLLSLYRTAFQHQLPGSNESHLPHHQLKSRESSIDSSNYSASGKLQKNKSGYSQHCTLEDHLGVSDIDDESDYPDRLSEDIIICISSIYCKLAKPAARAHKGNSVSSSSSFCSSSTMSPMDFSGSWSPQCSDEVAEVCGSKDLPSSAMVEVTEIHLNDETYNYTATMLKKFRSLVKSLANVDLTETSREQKLAFWINIHNALVMHSYLAYGTESYTKYTTTLKATYNVGGHSVNAYDIQRYILGIRAHYPAPWLQTLLSPAKKIKTENIKVHFAIEYPEPLVHFALSSGVYSDPAVRAYTAKSVFKDLNVAKEEFVRAKVQIHHKQRKVKLPKILQYYAKDMSLDITAVLEVVSECLTGTHQRDTIGTFVNGRPEKFVCWLEQSSTFRYLIYKEVADRRWGA